MPNPFVQLAPAALTQRELRKDYGPVQVTFHTPPLRRRNRCRRRYVIVGFATASDRHRGQRVEKQRDALPDGTLRFGTICSRRGIPQFRIPADKRSHGINGPELLNLQQTSVDVTPDLHCSALRPKIRRWVVPTNNIGCSQHGVRTLVGANNI